jgi:hypothetical protein
MKCWVDPRKLWTLWSREKYFAAAGIGIPDRPWCSLVKVAHEILWTFSLQEQASFFVKLPA